MLATHKLLGLSPNATNINGKKVENQQSSTVFISEDDLKFNSSKASQKPVQIEQRLLIQPTGMASPQKKKRSPGFNRNIKSQDRVGEEGDSSILLVDENDPFNGKKGSESINSPQTGKSGASTIADQIKKLKKSNKEKAPTTRSEKAKTLKTGASRIIEDRKTQLLSKNSFKANIENQKVDLPARLKENRLLQKLTESPKEEKKKWLIYPEEPLKNTWDVLVTITLIFICIVLPYRITFVPEDNLFWTGINILVDLIFLGDIILTFNTAIYDEDMQLIDARKTIAKAYLRSWFLIDLLGVIPFDLITHATGNAEMARFSKLSRMYKLTKLTRLVRVMKLFKKQKQIFQQAQELLKISAGLERLFNYFLTFFLLAHIVSCLWVLVATLIQDNGDPSWLDSYDEQMAYDKYMTSMYFTVTTITTVGYGDISAGETKVEKFFCIVIMVCGVISFSFASGSLSSIIQNYDSQNAKLANQVGVLNKVYQDFSIPRDLYQRLKLSLQHNSGQDIDHLNQFLEDLPQNLKIEASLYIHKETYKNIYFMKDKSMSLIAWMCPLLKAYLATPQEYIYFEGDEIVNIFFMKKGSCGFVLPKYTNTKYINISVGCDFGTEDIIACIVKGDDIDGEDWIQQKEKLIRQFTVMADQQTELFLLSINDLNRIQAEFLEAYSKLMDVASQRLEYALMIKVECINSCSEMQEQGKFNPSNLSKNKQGLTLKETIRPHKNTQWFRPFDLAELDQHDDDESVVYISSEEEDEEEESQSFSEEEEKTSKPSRIQEVKSELEDSNNEAASQRVESRVSEVKKEPPKTRGSKLHSSKMKLLLMQQFMKMKKTKEQNPQDEAEKVKEIKANPVLALLKQSSLNKSSTKAQDMLNRLNLGAATTNNPDPSKSNKIFNLFGQHLKNKIESKASQQPSVVQLKADESSKVEKMLVDLTSLVKKLSEDHSKEIEQLKADHLQVIDSLKEDTASRLQDLQESQALKIDLLESKIEEMRFRSITGSPDMPSRGIIEAPNLNKVTTVQSLHEVNVSELPSPEVVHHGFQGTASNDLVGESLKKERTKPGGPRTRMVPIILSPTVHFQMMGLNPMAHMFRTYRSPRSAQMDEGEPGRRHESSRPSPPFIRPQSTDLEPIDHHETTKASLPYGKRPPKPAAAPKRRQESAEYNRRLFNPPVQSPPSSSNFRSSEVFSAHPNQNKMPLDKLSNVSSKMNEKVPARNGDDDMLPPERLFAKTPTDQFVFDKRQFSNQIMSQRDPLQREEGVLSQPPGSGIDSFPINDAHENREDLTFTSFLKKEVESIPLSSPASRRKNKKRYLQQVLSQQADSGEESGAISYVWRVRAREEAKQEEFDEDDDRIPNQLSLRSSQIDN